MAKSDLHKDYVLELENELQEFEMKAQQTTKRMQMLVYPAMVAFFILASFGFYLIFSLTSDVNRMADTIVKMSGSVDMNMTSIAGTMDHMSGKMDVLASSTSSMSTNVGSMTDNTAVMVDSISGLKSATYDMAASTNNMQRDMWSLNKNISTPLSFMNNFLPWKDDQSLPFQGSREPLPQSYYSYPAQQPPAAYNPAGNQGLVPMPMGMPPLDYNGMPIPPAPIDFTVDSNDQSLLVEPLLSTTNTSASLN